MTSSLGLGWTTTSVRMISAQIHKSTIYCTRFSTSEDTAQWRVPGADFLNNKNNDPTQFLLVFTSFYIFTSFYKFFNTCLLVFTSFYNNGSSFLPVTGIYPHKGGNRLQYRWRFLSPRSPALWVYDVTLGGMCDGAMHIHNGDAIHNVCWCFPCYGTLPRPIYIYNLCVLNALSVDTPRCRVPGAGFLNNNNNKVYITHDHTDCI